jgi:hypothetical protein
VMTLARTVVMLGKASHKDCPMPGFSRHSLAGGRDAP